MGVKDLCNPIDGGQVSLVSVLAWCIREMRFNKLDNTNGNELNFKLKLDGRPFWGKPNIFKHASFFQTFSRIYTYDTHTLMASMQILFFKKV
jgi:hypothetical protein